MTMPVSAKTALARLALVGIFLLVFAQSASYGRSNERQSQDQEQNKIDRTLIVGAFAETTLRSIVISLQESKQVAMAAWVNLQKPPVNLVGKTLSDLAADLRKRLTKNLSAEQPDLDTQALLLAMERSSRFLRLDARLLEENIAIPAVRQESFAPATYTWEIEDATSCVGEVCWPGVASYAEDRLGPVKELIKTLQYEDRVILTNASELESSKAIPRLVSLRKFRLPLSSYGKTISLAVQDDGKRHLIFSDFDSRAYLIHFGLLINRFRQDRRIQFQIVEQLSAEHLNDSYNQLLSFAHEQPKLFASLDSLVIGYAPEFRRLWKKYQTADIAQKGFPGENWELSIFRFPEGVTVGVLAGDVDYYGEGLAIQLERLMTRFPVKKIFFGGSGGATIPRPLYDLYYPTDIRSPEGITTRNILTGSLDAGTHVSVESPLLESPLLLSRLQKGLCWTVDMEAGHLARLAVKFGIQLGVGILITDFPVGFGSIGITLGEQNFMAKIASREDFVDKVEGALRNGEKTWLHKIEQLASRTILDISRQNLDRYRRDAGSFSPEELEVVRRLQSLPFHTVLRMSPGRLYWALKNKALFSTGLLNTLGEKTSPYTPALEDEMFGAFDYVFAHYGTDMGQSEYGNVIVILKPEDVLPRCWATRGSGWRVASYHPEAPLVTHQQNFLQEVLHPEHFREAIALQAIYRFRLLNQSQRDAFLARNTATWPATIDELGFGRLELKIKSYVLCREIERVILPLAVRGEIPPMLQAHSIPYNYDLDGSRKSNSGKITP